MELNKINSSGNWGKAADDLNQNFSKVNNAVEQVKNATTRNKGYFSSEAALKSTFPSASVNDIAYVDDGGTDYAIWSYNGATWISTGKRGGEGVVNLGNYYDKSDTDTIIGEIEETVAANKVEADAKLSELGSKNRYADGVGNRIFELYLTGLNEEKKYELRDVRYLIYEETYRVYQLKVFNKTDNVQVALAEQPITESGIWAITTVAEGVGGYVIFNMKDTDTTLLHGDLNLSIVSDIEQSPSIKEFLNRKSTNDSIQKINKSLTDVDESINIIETTAQDDIVFLDGIVEENMAYLIDGGKKEQRSEYNCALIKVEPNAIYQTELKADIVVFFGNGTDDYRNEYIFNGRAFVTPGYCHYIGIDYSSASEYIGKRVRKLTPKDVIYSEDWGVDKSAYTIAANGEFIISDVYNSLLAAVEPKKRYLISTLNETNVDVVICYYDKNFVYLSNEITRTNTEITTTENSRYIGVSVPREVGLNYFAIAKVVGVNARIASSTSKPAYLEFKKGIAPNNAVVSVGMHGSTEANLCYNMDYNTGVHKYYDKNVGSTWLALHGEGGAMQCAPANLDDSGKNDMWALGGYRYAFWWNNYGKFVVGTDMNEDKGDAALSGNRSIAGGITLAGLTDCVIEGNRKKGTRGDIYLNSYNDGDLYICRGGGRVVVGGTANAKSNTPPVSSGDLGLKGEVRFCDDYIYVCVAANTWKRCKLETW